MVTAHPVTVRELRNRGGEVLDRVQPGEIITTTRDGRPVAELRAAQVAGVSTAELVARRRHLPPADPFSLRNDIGAVVDPSW